MTVSTPTVSGQILTSAYVNNNINSGLVYIKEQTIGSGVSSVEVTGAFSADYDSYKIIVTNVTCSANQPGFRLQLGTTSGSTYYYAGFEISYALGTLNASSLANGGFFYIGNFGNAASMSSEIDLYRPFLAQNTNYSSMSGSTNWSVSQNGYLNNTTSYTAFTLFPSSGALTGGTITVYGYRKA
jgi:hypothetical protein